jgi:hypothetical protein
MWIWLSLESVMIKTVNPATLLPQSISNKTEDNYMRSFKLLTLAAVAGLCFAASTAPKAQAQISINIGAEPACPYGYYDYAPYDCAPYGYYGPEWFTGGHFIGAGQWFHGPSNFHGKVDNHFDRQHGYKGQVPKRGEAPSHGAPHAIKGNETRDGRGHTVGKR